MPGCIMWCIVLWVTCTVSQFSLCSECFPSEHCKERLEHVVLTHINLQHIWEEFRQLALVLPCGLNYTVKHKLCLYKTHHQVCFKSGFFICWQYQWIFRDNFQEEYVKLVDGYCSWYCSIRPMLLTIYTMYIPFTEMSVCVLNWIIHHISLLYKDLFCMLLYESIVTSYQVYSLPYPWDYPQFSDIYEKWWKQKFCMTHRKR